VTDARFFCYQQWSPSLFFPILTPRSVSPFNSTPPREIRIVWVVNYFGGRPSLIINSPPHVNLRHPPPEPGFLGSSPDQAFLPPHPPPHRRLMLLPFLFFKQTAFPFHLLCALKTPCLLPDSGFSLCSPWSSKCSHWGMQRHSPRAYILIAPFLVPPHQTTLLCLFSNPSTNCKGPDTDIRSKNFSC